MIFLLFIVSTISLPPGFDSVSFASDIYSIVLLVIGIPFIIAVYGLVVKIFKRV